MREQHLTVEELIKYMDASDVSEEYLLWFEEVSEHMLTCGDCQAKLDRAVTVESICEKEGLAAGLSLMEHEEEIRRNILIVHLLRMQEQARMAELIRQIQNGFAERFTFAVANLQRSAGAARGEDAQSGRQVTLERSEDGLLLRIPDGRGEERLTVILRIEDGEPIIKEALWDEECGQYTALMDDVCVGGEIEIYVIGE